MSLTISSFKTRCKAPRRAQITPEYVERVVRNGFTSECKRQLSLSAISSQSVVRIRTLPLHLKVASPNLNEENLARLWAAEFVRALSAALQTGSAQNQSIISYQTRTEWLARFICDLVSGSAPSQWEYEEFADLFRLGTVDAVISLFQREAPETVPVLLFLEEQGRLESILLLFGDLAFEQLFVAIASTRGQTYVDLTIDDLLTAGALATSQPFQGGLLGTRRKALRWFLKLCADEQGAGESPWTPRRVLHVLMALDILTAVTRGLDPTMWPDQLEAEVLQRSGHSLNPNVVTLLEQVSAQAIQAGNGSIRDPKFNSLKALLEELAAGANLTGVPLTTNSIWLSSECAGLFLLVGLLDRLRWPQRIQATFGPINGPRALVFCLAGLALRLLDLPLDANRLDSGISIFAGWLEPASADLAACRSFLSSTTDAERFELLKELDNRVEVAKDAASDWGKTFDCLGQRLTREFAERVRGFRKANASFIARNFFRQTGRICIEEKRILVILEHNPFHIALHISSMDEAVESVSWLGGRRLEIQLEGL